LAPNSLTDTEIEINILKQKVEGLELRIQFLEKNWVYWTKKTKEAGQHLINAITDKVNKDMEKPVL
jgi:chaperonin cofactor prefoldin